MQQAGETHSQQQRFVFNQFLGNSITGFCRGKNFLRGDCRIGHALSGARREGGPCGVGLNAALVAAIAKQPIRLNGHMAHMSAHALSPTHHMTINDHAAADTR